MNNYIFTVWVIGNVSTDTIAIAAPTRVVAMEIFEGMGYSPSDIISIDVD